MKGGERSLLFWSEKGPQIMAFKRRRMRKRRPSKKKGKVLLGEKKFCIPLFPGKEFDERRHEESATPLGGTLGRLGKKKKSKGEKGLFSQHKGFIGKGRNSVKSRWKTGGSSSWLPHLEKGKRPPARIRCIFSKVWTKRRNELGVPLKKISRIIYEMRGNAPLAERNHHHTRFSGEKGVLFLLEEEREPMGKGILNQKNCRAEGKVSQSFLRKKEKALSVLFEGESTNRITWGNNKGKVARKEKRGKRTLRTLVRMKKGTRTPREQNSFPRTGNGGGDKL